MALAINEEFNPWAGNISPDGIWRKAGVWYGSGGNELDPARAVLTSTYPGESSTGFLELTITPSTNPLEGAEIQTLAGYGYGYYEVRMMPSSVSGGVASFFLIGAPDYREPEFDIEFLLNAHNQVTFSNHPGSGGATYYNLGFDPTADFHNYGILWTPGPGPGVATVADTVDGVIVHSETSANFVASPSGEFIMMNAWSGNANFGGGPPTQNSTSVYDWVHFTSWDGESPLPPPPSAGTVSISDASFSEGNSDTKQETFAVTRSGGTAAFDVSFATSNGSATTADGDYVAKSGILHFDTNQNTQTISVTVNGDTKVELNESFNVNLSNATNGATISGGQGVGTITNDDAAPPPTNIIGTSRNDNLVGTAGPDTINGRGGNDTLDGGAGSDTLTGGRGNDTFIFHAGEANGDVITDFNARGTDSLKFRDYGIGSLVQLDDTHWQINSADDPLVHDVIQVNTPIHGTDFYWF